jgi:NADH-quinone oxidoreductase subunit G
VIVGQGALARADGAAVLAPRRSSPGSAVVKDGWNGFNVLHTAAARVGALDIGFVPGEGGLDRRHAGPRRRARSCCSCSAPTRSTPADRPAFVVYHRHHGDRGAHRADVILPGAAYTEKDGTYVNTEGRVQMAKRAASRRAMRARTGRSCARCRSARQPLPFDSLAQLRAS